MAGWIAKRITQILVASAVVKEDDTELYIYGFFMLVSRILFLFVTVVTGFLTGILPESILFYVVFTLLRTYAGGVHAKTETACTIFTTFAIVVSVLLIRLLEIFAAGTTTCTRRCTTRSRARARSEAFAFWRLVHWTLRKSR